MKAMTAVMSLIKKRLREFETLGSKESITFNFSPFLDLKLRATIQTELVFCISTANSSAISGLRFQKLLENLKLNEIPVEYLEELMRSTGVRFYRRKAIYIKSAIDRFNIVKKSLKMETTSAREYLVKNIRGLGYKEASHFLRNVGRRDVAIIDRHVLKWLYDEGYLEKIPKNLNSYKYEKLERILSELALKKGVTLAKLDLMIWYKKTGMILK